MADQFSTLPDGDPLKKIFSATVAVFGDEDKAKRWLDKPHPELSGNTPWNDAKTQDGRERVKTILGWIKHGIYGYALK